ncbi:MAG: hypothetical protein DME35_06530 [Verrucomicrobia bacterium]|nr:MAG: hypothetical protein DME35_06530 [Verrucomicrobiota bacterium]PYL28528.1 MAG: hypothetical protein DMF45_08890 [Verrucomicrobiota bacterium]
MRTGGAAFLVVRIIAPLRLLKIDILGEPHFAMASFRRLTGCRRFVRTPAWAKWGEIRCLTVGVGFVLKGTEHRIEPRFGPETASKKQLFFLLTNF